VDNSYWILVLKVPVFNQVSLSLEGSLAKMQLLVQDLPEKPAR
jgi:hypothetical protein